MMGKNEEAAYRVHTSVQKNKELNMKISEVLPYLLNKSCRKQPLVQRAFSDFRAA